MSKPSQDPPLKSGLLGIHPPPIVGIFLTVFLDLLGFGILIPDIQLRGKELAGAHLGANATPGQIALLTGFALAAFSLLQLLSAPILGRWSDKVGRRKILLITTLLSVVAYLIYAHATVYWVMVLSRAVSGVAAANIGVAFAYIADVTKPQDRAKGMGALGAAFGLGFIMGPPLGVLLLSIGHNQTSAIGYPGAAFALLNFIYVLLFLEESVTESRVSERHFFADFAIAFRSPGLGLMLVMFFALNFGFTNMETTFIQLLADTRSIFHLGDESAKHVGGLLMGYTGIIVAIMQGFVVRRFSKRYGETKILRYSYLGFVPALLLLPFAPLWIPLMCVQFLMATSMGFSQPNMQSLISKSAPRNVQGGIFGITQSLGALARCIGPLISNPLFAWRPYAPYVLGATIILFPAFAAWQLKPPIQEPEAGPIPGH